MSLVKTRVERGAALLDRKRPGWWKLINLSNLCMYSCSLCMVGQLYGFFDTESFRTLGLKYDSDDDILHGFNIDEDEEDEPYTYADLKEEWCRVILQRREQEGT